MYDLYESILINVKGNQTSIWDLIESFNSLLPKGICYLHSKVGDNSAFINIFYKNSKNNFDYLNNLVDIVSNDYAELNFDINYAVSGYNKTTNFIICIFILIVFVFLKLYQMIFVYYTQKDSRAFVSTIGISVSTILCVITMIYFEKITKMISLSIYSDEQKMLLIRNIMINVFIILFFSFIDIILQKIVIYFCSFYDNKLQDYSLDKKKDNN